MTAIVLLVQWTDDDGALHDATAQEYNCGADDGDDQCRAVLGSAQSYKPTMLVRHHSIRGVLADA